MTDLTPRTLDERHLGNLHATASRVIHRTPDVVFAALVDAPAWPTWMPLTRAAWTSAPPHGVGSRREVGLPGGITIREEFIVWEPQDFLAFTFVGVEGPARLAITGGVESMALDAVGDDRTRLTYTLDISVRGPAFAQRLLVAPGAAWSLDRALRKLDRRLAE